MSDVESLINKEYLVGSGFLTNDQYWNINNNYPDDYNNIIIRIGIESHDLDPRDLNQLIDRIQQANDDERSRVIYETNQVINDFRDGLMTSGFRTGYELYPEDDESESESESEYELDLTQYEATDSQSEMTQQVQPIYIDSVDRYREKVGGPIWQGIVQRENEYWDAVTQNRIRDRPDWDNVVGGLIDVTDHIEELREQFSRPDTSNWLVGRGVSDQVELEESNQLDSLQQLIGPFSNRFCIAGGAALSEVVGTKTKDIDIFYIDPSSEGIEKEMWSNDINAYATYLKMLSGENYYRLLLSQHSLTINCSLDEGITQTVQVILRVYRSLTEVLNGFDIGACGVGIYKGRIYATERALYEIVNRTIMVSMNRASTSYTYRLIKYALKGFGLYVEGVESFPSRDDDYFFEEIPSMLEIIDAMVRHGGWFAQKGRRHQFGDGYHWNLPNLPIGMESDYSQNNNSGTRDAIDYEERREPTILLKSPRRLPSKFNIIYKNPFRQGSLSFHPVTMSLREWAGPDAVIVETGQQLSSRLDDDRDWLELSNDEISDQFSNLLNPDINVTDVADLVGLSLLDYYRS